MASLSSELEGVVDALSSSINLRLQTLSTIYRQKIQRNAEALDSAGRHGRDASSIDRAIKSSKACKILLGENVVTPDEQSYKEKQQKNWSTTCHLPAASFIKIQNPIEVALALKIVTHMQCSFAVRSAGHSANPGFASVGASGIVIDLSSLNTTTLSDAKDVASVGPGATWDKVYETLEKHELAVVGGRAPGVGVGGLITGGGMSHFSNRWGMVCDNVKNFEVVLADSSIIQANAVENTDLFRALKGGGANFGIITRFDLYTYPDFKVWYTFKVYNTSDYERIMKGTVELQKAMEVDDRIGFFLSVNAGFIVGGMVYLGGTPPPLAFQAFDGIEPMMTAVPETLGTHASACLAAATEGVAKREVGVVNIKVDEELYVELHKVFQAIVTNTASYSLAFTFQPLGAAAVKKGEQKGGNSMNIPAESQAWLGILAQWTDDTEDDLARSQIRRLISTFESTAKARGLLLDFHFMNDCSHLQSPLQSYGAESLAFLRIVSKKRDPQGVFQKLQNSGYLLSKVDIK